MRYHGDRIPVLFHAYQRPNGVVAFDGPPAAVDNVRAVAERCAGLYPEGKFDARVQDNRVELRLRDVNASVLPLIEALRSAANRVSSLEGEIDVSSFRPGDQEDYCRFISRDAEMLLARPALWRDAPADEPPRSRPPGVRRLRSGCRGRMGLQPRARRWWHISLAQELDPLWTTD